ncbi:ABC transporter ATP-binding protein [Stieleria sp. JC731]|uniref:ABC transporter ATP-binding protein n=1 Tax=Pirellulaceae TaxID=2691357 RepID=UPI001E39CD00|nr:ABC transporter ATP-binding protein [Stieleria sp. JC731]MCC9601238.1 ABC transporter ATP-binding protein [Stieleria sp. JC731]
MTISIKIDDLSKRYDLGLTHANSLRDLANTSLERMLRWRSRTKHQQTDPKKFWALRNINLRIDQGEVVGLIGKNGAGKSTLLKILSRITYPTSGQAELTGRVASLLEVGTGFHPELTGRENIFLNGTILGMTRREIQTQLDDIVDFAGVAKFLDTPVKRYSSGMKVRLGFAVAAHLDPEILIVDEVLAVGDIAFQKQCLSKMRRVADSGRTVLFVSHNLASIRSLTKRCIVLSEGSVLFDGKTSDAVEVYFKDSLVESNDVKTTRRDYPNLTKDLEFVRLRIHPTESSESIALGAPWEFEATIRSNKSVQQFVIGLTIYDRNDSAVGSTFSAKTPAAAANETATYRWSMPLSLAPGQYHCSISIMDFDTHRSRIHDSLSNTLPFTVELPLSDSQGWQLGWGSIRLPELTIANPKWIAPSA